MSLSTRTFTPRLLRPVIAAAIVMSLLLTSARVIRTTHAATPGSGSIGTSQPTTSWDFAPVVGANSGVTPIVTSCPSGPCDNFDLTIGTPPAGMVGTLTIVYTWNNPVPTDLDIFAVNPGGSVFGPGNPDNISSGAGQETLTLDASTAGVYHIRSVAGTTPAPTAAHAVATIAYSVPGTGGGATFSSASISFAPATIVNANFLCAEPQLQLERPIPSSLSGAISTTRGFVDCPLSTRTQTSLLNRTLDGGNSFRLLLDLTCAARNKPACDSLGGGDSINRVNLYDGSLYFGDQEGVANEALSSSVDHGDSFPATRQFAISNPDAGVDRQWISTVDAPGITGGTGEPLELRGFYSYHIPAAGEYIQGIDATGKPIPQPAPQLTLVSQSGPSRVDEQLRSPGKGYIYQSFRDGNGFEVGVSPINGYQSPTSWKVGHVSDDQPAIFPWINLDNAGNLYAVWVTGGKVFYSYSLIGDPKNNPAKGGTPATTWAPKIQVNMPSVTGAVFPEIVAGSPGRVAILYYGSADAPPGPSDNAGTTATWYPYLAVTTNGLSSSPTIATGKVSHRVVHVGSICTSGTTCTGDRSLLDMVDVQIDKDGRAGVVFTDNNNQFARDTTSSGAKGSPFMKFAKLSYGPSLFVGHAQINVATPTTSRSAPSGDALWPNRAYTNRGTNLTSLDLTGSSVSFPTGSVRGCMSLVNAGKAQMLQDIQTYNSVPQVGAQATRVLYVFRYETAYTSDASQGDVYYMAYEQNADGTTRSFGGKLDGTDQLAQSANAVGYHDTHPTVPVHASIARNTLCLSGAQSDFGVSKLSPLYSVSAFSMTGPAESIELAASDAMRILDATPPFDAIAQ